MISRIDQIIATRIDRKGIIHTVSHARTDQIRHASQFSRYMFFTTGGNTKDVVEAFKLAKKPAILVGPNLTTGYDFPGEQCEYQVILKTPFPSRADLLLQARAAVMPNLIESMVVKAITQIVGRGQRSSEDWCEAFILDSHFEWFYKQNFHRFSMWFNSLIIQRGTLPDPLERGSPMP